MRRRATARRLRRRLLVAVALLTVGIVVLLEATDALRGAELASITTRFEIRGERPVPDDVVVVGIDDVTFRELDERYPFNRRTFAKALDEISRDRPRAIVFDVEFAEQSDDVEGDNRLVRGTRRAGNVVLSATEVDQSGMTKVFGGLEAQRVAKATIGNGLFPEDSTADSAVRRVPYAIHGLRTLSVATVERVTHRPLDRRRFAGAGAWIDYSGPPGHIRHVSFSRAVDRRFKPGTFTNRVAVIGAMTPSLEDLHRTSWGADQMYGPEIHANAIDTLLRDAPLHDSGGLADLLIGVGLALLPAILGLLLRPFLALTLGAAAVLLYALVVQVAFDRGLILPVAVPLPGLALVLLGAVAVFRLTSSLERTEQRQRELFSRFLPDSVVAQVLERANTEEDLRLGGELLTATVLFSDLRGFTSFAEGREPSQVIEILNRYLAEMTDAILDHEGTLVTYMGDGIMAVFGAPMATEDHARQALAAARAMLERLERFNAWMREQGLGDNFKMGIGLNTGDVMSGNVGSSRRLEYTAIGDTTNATARLERMTKHTPYQLFVADATYARLPEPPADFDYLDELEVRGRRAGMKVWGLRPDTAVGSEGP